MVEPRTRPLILWTTVLLVAGCATQGVEPEKPASRPVPREPGPDVAPPQSATAEAAPVESGAESRPVYSTLVIHRGIPLIDLSGHGWKTLEDYTRNVRSESDAILIEIGFGLKPLVARLWPDVKAALEGPTAERPPRLTTLLDKLALKSVRTAERLSEEEWIDYVAYTTPDTQEYRRLAEALRQELKVLRIAVDGHELRLENALVIDGFSSPTATTFLAAPKKALTVTVTRGTKRLTAPLGQATALAHFDGRLEVGPGAMYRKRAAAPDHACRAHGVVRCQGRTVPCIAGEVVFRYFTGDDECVLVTDAYEGMGSFLCLHPHPPECWGAGRR